MVSDLVLDKSMVMRNAPCIKCGHWNGWDDMFSCKAFEKISETVITGRNPHTNPIEGDQGLQFKEVKVPTIEEIANAAT